MISPKPAYASPAMLGGAATPQASTGRPSLRISSASRTDASLIAAHTPWCPLVATASVASYERDPPRAPGVAGCGSSTLTSANDPDHERSGTSAVQ